MPFFDMTFIWFPRPELFFQRKCLFFGLRHFGRQRCALFSYDFFYEFTRFFKTRIAFSTRLFVFWSQAFCKTVRGLFFTWIYKPESFSQRECLFFWFQAFCKAVLCPFSHELQMNLQGF